jgi:hypothetical protein
MNWARLFNRLFEIIDSDGPTYFSGGRYISAVSEVDAYFPSYNQYISDRKRLGKSTSRKDYFYDILLSLGTEDRVELINAVLSKVEQHQPQLVQDIRSELGGHSPVPAPKLDADTWNAERLGRILLEMDARIASGNYDGAVTLAYTCLEGFLKAFVRNRLPQEDASGDIIQLSKIVRAHLKISIGEYPAEALTLLNHIAHTLDRARNQFSDSHFDSQASRWLAIFLRDLVNAEIRLLLHFMS